MNQSIFTQIRLGKIPGHLLYEDKSCFVLLTNMPHNSGHLLVVPIEEIESWEELEKSVWLHLCAIAQEFGKITKKVFNPPKVGLAIVGFHVAHVHLHVFSMQTAQDINQDHATAVTDVALQAAAETILSEITAMGGIHS